MSLVKMGLKGKLTAEIEVESSGHHVHDHFSTKPHNLLNVCPWHFQGFHLHKGELGKPGSIYFWSYTIGGKACTAKSLLESVDEEDKTVSFKFIEGHPLENYKLFVFHIHATDNEVKWIAEYEKLHEDGPHPTDYLSMAIDISENLDDHHHKS